jgi:eukaryotic-like serine/threonine-protein kinase
MLSNALANDRSRRTRGRHFRRELRGRLFASDGTVSRGQEHRGDRGRVERIGNVGVLIAAGDGTRVEWNPPHVRRTMPATGSVLPGPSRPTRLARSPKPPTGPARIGRPPTTLANPGSGTVPRRSSRGAAGLARRPSARLLPPICLVATVRSARKLPNPRREAQLDQPTTATQGQLSFAAIADVLAGVEASGKSAEVSVQGELDSGSVWIRDGRVVDAQMGLLTGESACRALLALDVGSFEVRHCEVDRPATIQRTVKELLDRASHRSSSWARLLTQSPGLNAVLEVDTTVYADFDWTLEADERELARLVDGKRTIEEIIAAFGGDPVTTLGRVVNLCNGGLFRKVTPTSSAPPPAEPAELQDQAALRPTSPRSVKAGLVLKAPPKPSASLRLRPKPAETQPPSGEPEPGSRYSVRPTAVEIVPATGSAVARQLVPPRFGSALCRTATLIGPGPVVPPATQEGRPRSGPASPREETKRPSVVPQRTIAVDSVRPTVVIPRSGESPNPSLSAAAGQPEGFVGDVSPRPSCPPGGASPTAEQAFLGRYQVLCRIGRGGMGSVYLCRVTGEAGFRRLFALKVLRRKLKDDPESVQLFLQEARVAARVHHPNVVAVLDASVHGTQPYLVMDYVEGCSLHTLLERNPTYRPPELVLPIILDALNGLRSIHLLTREDGLPVGLVHCDVSPDNLLVGVDGACRISDFGIARMSGGSPVASSRGKLAFLAPERVTGGPVDQRADVYSLGVVLYNALTGVQLFQGATAEETLWNVQRAQIVPPSQVGLRPPAYLDPICMRALARDIAARYASADEMMYELSRVMARHEVVARVGDVAAWVTRTVGPELEMRRLATLDGSQRFGSDRPRAPLASVPPGTSTSGHPPPLPVGPSADPGLAASAPQHVDASDDGSGVSPRWRKAVLIAASALAVLAVAVSILWPAAVGSMFSIDRGTMPISVDDQPRTTQTPGVVPPPSAEPRLPPLPLPSSTAPAAAPALSAPTAPDPAPRLPEVSTQPNARDEARRSTVDPAPRKAKRLDASEPVPATAPKTPGSPAGDLEAPRAAPAGGIDEVPERPTVVPTENPYGDAP